ncbi:hypothetical protein HAX54_044592 [Datura stramonium]|uniref:Uncharacterized protein n=1 Tax=Datura stramonium TaxID=4076 RepID=A0ABS8SPB6_DATST|nr:hypothetical protein [Datura stramonium]
MASLDLGALRRPLLPFPLRMKRLGAFPCQFLDEVIFCKHDVSGNHNENLASDELAAISANRRRVSADHRGTTVEKHRTRVEDIQSKPYHKLLVPILQRWCNVGLGKWLEANISPTGIPSAFRRTRD